MVASCLVVRDLRCSSRLAMSRMKGRSHAFKRSWINNSARISSATIMLGLGYGLAPCCWADAVLISFHALLSVVSRQPAVGEPLGNPREVGTTPTVHLSVRTVAGLTPRPDRQRWSGGVLAFPLALCRSMRARTRLRRMSAPSSLVAVTTCPPAAMSALGLQTVAIHLSEQWKVMRCPLYVTSCMSPPAARSQRYCRKLVTGGVRR